MSERPAGLEATSGGFAAKNRTRGDRCLRSRENWHSVSGWCEQPLLLVSGQAGQPGIDLFEISQAERACPVSCQLVVLAGSGLDRTSRRFGHGWLSLCER